MASNVVVLLPNGKRQLIKTTPMMTLKQIVNTVCEKQKMTDVEKWGLKQNKTTLDLGLSVRFANLSPGAKLDLIRITTQKVHSDVQVALQLDDGGRLIGKFQITTSLWDILIHFENFSQDGSLNLTKRTASAPKKKNFLKKIGGQSKDPLFYQQPVCLLLNKEYGTIPSLKSTTLQSAGITSGNIALRLLFRNTESSIDDVLNDIITPIQTPNNDTILDDTSVAVSSTVSVDESKKIDVEQSNPEIHLPDPPKESTDEPLKIDATDPIDESKEIDVEQSSSKIHSSVVPTEPNDEPPKINATAPTELIERIDVEQSTSEIHSSTIQKSTDEQSNSGNRSSTVLDSANESLKTDVKQNVDSMEIDSSLPDQASITFNNNHKVVITPHFEQIQPSESVHESEMSQKMTDSINQSSEGGGFDRNVKVFNPLPDNVQFPTKIDLPDSFYELTASELKFLLAMQNSKRISQENAGFRTSKVRAREEEEKERKYPKTLIRVRFPDGFQLQIAFMSRETVAKLYEFVKGTLRKPHCTFELYTSPPKKVLSDQDLTLFHAELTPASVVYFIWLDKFENGSGPYLSEEYLKLREDIPQIQTMEDVKTSIIPENSTIKPEDAGHTLSEPSSRKDEGSSGKKKAKGSGINRSIPKWFRKQ